jgi:iron complex transport system permease protein
MSRSSIWFIIFGVLLVVFFFFDIMLGSVKIPMDTVLSVLKGAYSKPSWHYIILNFRLPKAITAILAGAGMAVTGLQMQTLFKNPLTDTSILGIGNGASLGVALFVLASALFPSVLLQGSSLGNMGVVIAAVIGASVVLLCVSAVAMWLNDMVSILIIGLMFGFITGSLVGILQYFSNPDMIKSYLLWTLGSLSGVTWTQMKILAPIVLTALSITMLFPKSMNALLLGEQYARSVGVKVTTMRNSLIGLTSLIAGTLTAFIGPIAFVGIAVPFCARLLFKTSDHRILIPASMLCGAVLLLFCDMVSQLPGHQTTLPINSVTALIGAPVVVAIILKNRRNKTVFN